MGTTACTYLNGQVVYCPCNNCWTTYQGNSCPPCALAWYYWVIISIGIIGVISSIAGVIIRRRRRRMAMMNRGVVVDYTLPNYGMQTQGVTIIR